MLFKVPEPSLDEVALKAIHYKVRLFVKYGQLREHELEDLVQDIWIHLQKKQKHFDPQRSSWSTFCALVARHYLSRELKRRVQKRRARRRRLESLSEKKYDERGKAYYEEDRVELQHSYESVEEVTRCEQREVDFRHDLATTLETMSVEHREFCTTYLRCESLSGVARQLGMSCKTVYRMREQIRAELSTSDLHEYR